MSDAIYVHDLDDGELARAVDARIEKPGRVVTCPDCGVKLVTGWTFTGAGGRLLPLVADGDAETDRLVSVMKRHAAAVYEERWSDHECVDH